LPKNCTFSLYGTPKILTSLFFLYKALITQKNFFVQTGSGIEFYEQIKGPLSKLGQNSEKKIFGFLHPKILQRQKKKVLPYKK